MRDDSTREHDMQLSVLHITGNVLSYSALATLTEFLGISSSQSDIAQFVWSLLCYQTELLAPDCSIRNAALQLLETHFFELFHPVAIWIALNILT